METNNRKPEWMFYLGWVGLSAISLPIAWIAAWAIISQIVRVVGDTIMVGGQTHITEDYLYMYVWLPMIGLVAGALQYLLLRRYMPRMGWWIAATFLGWLLLTVVLKSLDSLAMNPWVVAFVFPAGSFGLVQWLALRQGVRHAALWILATALGWGIALVSAHGWTIALQNSSISTLLIELSTMLLPPVAGGIAWWLLLDRLPQRMSNAAGSAA